jgi:large-conductance mechanosensitive channel
MLKKFIKDDFFSKGHIFTKIRQSLFAIIMWIPVLLPILITANSTVFRKVKDQFYRWDYRGGFVLYRNLTAELVFFLIAVVIIAFLLAHRNNYRMEHYYKQKKMYDEAKLEQKAKALEAIYTERFGAQTFRENVTYYSVAPEKNLADDLVKETFRQLEESK